MDDRRWPYNDAWRHGRRVFDGAYRRADSVLDRGQHHAFRLFWFFLPETSLLRNVRFQPLLASKFLSDAGQQTLAYGALIAVVRGGGSAFDAALVGVAALVPPALLGLYGGAVADALPRRIALAAVYNAQAALCFIVPAAFGTELFPIMVLLFAVNTLGQVSGPTESAVVPHVATHAELASAASLINLASSAGTAFGTALLAPLLVRVAGTDVTFYIAGVLLLLAATRIFDLPLHPEEPQRFDWRKRPEVDIRAALRWLVHERAVATMIVVAVLAGTANIVLQTLAPRYVSSVLNVDPADAVYVFAPTAVGLLSALAVAPALIRRFGERLIAVVGFGIVSVTLVLLGAVDQIAPALDAINPMRAVDAWLPVHLSRELRTAGLLAVFVGFGLTLTTVSVHTYINRRVPLKLQGRAFALQSTLKNGSSIMPLLVLGGAATWLGVETVLLFSPLLLLALAVSLVRLSYVVGGGAPAGPLREMASFWEEPVVEGVSEGGGRTSGADVDVDRPALSEEPHPQVPGPG